MATETLLIDGAESTQLLTGKRALRSCLSEVRQLRRRCGQEDDCTTDPEYFMAANALGNRRCALVLIRSEQRLEACVLFYEHCRFGLGLGLFRGGDYVGESLVAGPAPLRVHYVHLATQALLQQWRIHGVSLSIKAPVEQCIAVMGPAAHHRRFFGTEVMHRLPLPATYEAMLAGLGPGTRRSLARKRKKLEQDTSVQFFAALDPPRCLEVMRALRAHSLPARRETFFVERQRLIHAEPDFFSMGLRLPNGQWLSVLSGWRRGGVTYVDLQMNHAGYKKECISAVMRAFMLQHEIERKQHSINFVGGSSVLLRRYCEPVEACTDIFISKPGMRSRVFEMVATRMKQGSVYERLKPGVLTQP